MDVDHYLVLELPSGEEGAKLTVDNIKKAYRSKALELHPDKKPGDKQALANFQRLQSSYEILKDEKARKCFDDLLRVKRGVAERDSKHDAKRRKMFSDLEERERAASDPDAAARERAEEERTARKLKEEIASIRANKAAAFASKVSLLQTTMTAEIPMAPRSVESDRLSNLVGANYDAFEAAVLVKLRKGVLVGK